MNVAGEYILGVIQDGTGVIGKDDLALATHFPDQLGVVLHIVHTGEGVLDIAKQFPVFLFAEDILIGVNALFIHQIPVDEVVAHFVRGIAEHQNDLLAALCDATQADCKAVAAEDGEHDTNSFTTQLGAHISGNIVHTGVIALGTGHYGLGHSNDITVTGSETVFLHSFQDAASDDFYHIITLTDDGGTQTHRNSTKHTAHLTTLPIS